ncbi:MAG: hypothetical protein K2H41_00755 [Acetatifactor sp.]|nr:hypothetical protein [Acetatifactor sp.]MDE7114249.1 hypothetical protein [Acetatifactor sp.]
MKTMEMANIKKTVGTLALATVLAFELLLCSGCGTASKTLTDEEIAGFNTEFFNSEANKMNNMLLSSEYDTPEEIDLFELFYNGFYNSVSGNWSQAGEEELAILAELDDAAIYLDVMKVTAEEMEAVLQEKLGLSLEETQKKGLENFYYLEEYDSYYLVHGDTNFDWCTVTSGIRESGDRLTLEYTKEYEGGQWVVTLQKTDDGYLFVSNRRAD